MNQPLLAVNNLTHLYAPDKGFRDVSLELWPGEVLGIVGESGSGKTTLLKAISARLTPQQGEVLYQQRSLYAMSEAERRRLLRTEWGVVHQHPMDGLRRQVSAGGNIGERLMAPAPATTATFAPPPKSGCRRWRFPLAHRRPAHHLLRRHAAASADRPQSGHPAEAGVYG